MQGIFLGEVKTRKRAGALPRMIALEIGSPFGAVENTH